MVKSSLKLWVISASIGIVGCSSKPYEAGEYALSNQRVTSEISLDAVEPDEQFSDAMRIMYDYSQVDIDYKNNLDAPYVKGKSITKDVLSLGGTAALIAQGASFADVGSFFFGSSSKKEISSMYSMNAVLRFVDVSEKRTQSEIKDTIIANRNELAGIIKDAYTKSGIKVVYLDSTNLEPKATDFWGASSNYIVPLNNEDESRNYSPLCEVPVVENVSSLKSLGFIRDGDCQVRVWQRIQLTKNDSGTEVPAFNGKDVKQYLIITAFLPSDFPMGSLSSSYEYDYAYTPAYAWLSKPHKFAQAYGAKEMENKLERRDVSMLPRLVNLYAQKEVEFTYQTASK
ncbi:hypothetical protein J4N45_04555 [Vibrio sp. SCSIO 43140]|uniref:hypothetical protein n=1 Tax=Vibrio sp. SCSIO 43140 TaxID=2819100 RepID=UPI00207529A6|nr:hypothetical protein [Vibrio sp. SCSIO 43140]USD61250.1 hypothetical protein J4N45_04555 [Vibrio sp. SCSIO 43140]